MSDIEKILIVIVTVLMLSYLHVMYSASEPQTPQEIERTNRAVRKIEKNHAEENPWWRHPHHNDHEKADMGVPADSILRPDIYIQQV